MTNTWQKDAQKEREKLSKKLHKLVDFQETKEFEKLSRDMQNMLMTQTTIMAAYVNILVARLEYMEN